MGLALFRGSVGEQEGAVCDTDGADHSREGTNESWTCSAASVLLCLAAAAPAGVEKASHPKKYTLFWMGAAGELLA